MLIEIYLNHGWHWELQRCIIMISNIVVIAWKMKARNNTYIIIHVQYIMYKACIRLFCIQVLYIARAVKNVPE